MFTIHPRPRHKDPYPGGHYITILVDPSLDIITLPSDLQKRTKCKVKTFIYGFFVCLFALGFGMRDSVDIR